MEWIFIVVILIILVLLLIVYFAANKIYESFLGTRMEDNGTLYYFTCEDYKDINLKRRTGIFESDGNKLKYFIYENETSSKDEYIFFCHGLGPGHIQYMEEIAFFVKNGYQVFTYDVRGCNESEGKGIGAFTNALKDMHNAMSFVENDEEFKNRKILLYGHSMGGFCVNNISHYEHPNIIGAVSMASFNDSKTLFDDIITRSISNQAILLSKIMTSIEHSYNKEISDISSLKSLENVTYPMLMISGDKDEVVYPKSNYELFKNKFEHSELFEFMLMPDRGHRPNISISATEYCKEVDKKIDKFNKLPSKEKTEEHKKTLYQSFDYRKMVEFDMEVMNKVLNFYKKCKKY